MFRRLLAWLVMVLGGVSLCGCAGPSGGASVTFAAERYGEAFDAAREELRAAGYTLERIDAGAGEILTAPKITAGFVTPFEPEFRPMAQAWRDTVNAQPRTVRIRFRDDEPGEPGAPPPTEGTIVADVEVVIWRQRRAGWRLETETIRASEYWSDPGWGATGVRANMRVPIRRDEAFAAELASGIRGRLDRSSRSPR
jgi:hypothetical protein